jgi:hypothetical protein
VPDPFRKPGTQLAARLECIQINAFVFQRPPKPLDEYVVHPTAPAIHADPDARRLQHARKPRAGELGRFNWPSQQLMEGVVMAVQKRRSDRVTRDGLRSPGRPKAVRRDEQRGFWQLIAAGLSSEDAAVGAGVSQAVGTRWFREAGGMPPSTLAPSSKPASGRYLSFAEREELARLIQRGAGIRWRA